jgi:hypothetical protein
MKTAHQFARELLKGPDLPIYHFDPSRAGMADESDPSLSPPEIQRENPRAGMTRAQLKEAREEGWCLKPFLTIVDTSGVEVDDEPGAYYEKMHRVAEAAGMLSPLQRRELEKITRESAGARLLGAFEIRKKGDLFWSFEHGTFHHLANPRYIGKPVPVGEVWARREEKPARGR